MLIWESLGKNKSLTYVLPLHWTTEQFSMEALLYSLAIETDVEERYWSTPFSMLHTTKLQRTWASSAGSTIFLGVVLLHTLHCKSRAVPPALLKLNIDNPNASELSSSVTSEEASRVGSGSLRVNPPSTLPTLPSPQPLCAIRLPGAIVISLCTLGGNYTTWGESLPYLSPEASPQH